MVRLAMVSISHIIYRACIAELEQAPIMYFAKHDKLNDVFPHVNAFFKQMWGTYGTRSLLII
jgi:hypothetical protein